MCHISPTKCNFLVNPIVNTDLCSFTWEGLHYEGYISIYRGCNTFFMFSIERGIIVVKDKIGVISAQLYVTFW